MSSFRYDTSGQWFKGNTHVHTTISDGGTTPEKLAGMYAAAGYDFLCRTDHGIASGYADAEEAAPLLWLDGVELDGADRTGAYYHVVCLGTFRGLTPEMTLEEGLAAAREQGGLLIIAHPNWCANTLDDVLRHDFDGVEIYNHVCQWLNGKGDGLYLWDKALERKPNTLAFAVDDAHVRPEHPGWDGGWIMVNAAECTREAIFAAIRAGNFYSSCGPEFHSIECDGASVTVRTSPVSFIRLVGPATRGVRVGSFEGKTFTEATFEIPPDWATRRLEIEDAAGRRAWTNTLFGAP